MDGNPSTSGTLLKDTITKNYQELCNAIDCNDLFLTLLYSNGLITQGLMSEVESIHDNLTKAVKILDFLKDCRTDADFSKFVDILKASGYSKAVDIIQKPVTLSSTTSFGYQGVVAGYIERHEPQKQALEHLTAKPNRNTQITFPVVVLHGFGGNGKSQMARRLVQILSTEVNYTENITKCISVWINAVDEGSLLEGFRNFANVTKTENVSSFYKEWKNRNLLLVLDDGDDFVMLKKFLPLDDTDTNVRVIITAHSEWFCSHQNVKNIPVANFTVTEFHDFVSEAVSYPISDREFKQLEGHTGRIPAILNLVCKGFSRRFKRDATYTISKHFEKYGDEIFIFGEDGKCIPGLTVSNYKKSARIVVEQQLEYMDNRESDDSPELIELAKFILNCIAYCNPNEISEKDFFKKHPQILRNANEDYGEIRQAIGILKEFGWVELAREEDGENDDDDDEKVEIYSMHACYQIGLKSQFDEQTSEFILHGMIDYMQAESRYSWEKHSHLAAFWSYISIHSKRNLLLNHAMQNKLCLTGLAEKGLMDEFKSLASAYQDRGHLVHSLLQDDEDFSPSSPMYYLFLNAANHELVKYIILEIKAYYDYLKDSETKAWIRHQILCATIGGIQSNEYELFHFTLDTFDLNVNECLGQNDDTLLHRAASTSYSQFVQLLIEKLANVNEKNVDGETPLHMAVWNLRTVTAFVEKSANVNGKNVDGETLHSARDSVRVLLANGANVHEKNARGETALHCAVYRSNLEVVKLFVEKGANVNEKNVAGQTPIHVAVQEAEEEENNLEIIKCLVEHGANMYEINCDGDTAVQLAFQLKNQDIVDFFIHINQSFHE